MHRRYRDTTESIVAWAAAEPDIHGVVVIGSQSRCAAPLRGVALSATPCETSQLGEPDGVPHVTARETVSPVRTPHSDLRSADEWSDLDLMLLAGDPDRWLSGGDGWLEAFGAPVAVFTELTPLGWTDWDWAVRRVLYADGRDVDFSLLPAAHATQVIEINTQILRYGYRVLYDPAGTLEEQIAQAVAEAGAVPTTGHEADAVLLEDIQVLLYHVVWAGKKIRRGEIWVAAGCLNGFLRGPLLALIEAYNGATGVPQGPLPYGGRFLEQRTAPEVLALLRGCAMPYEAAAGMRALYALLDLVEHLAPVVCAARGLPWDAERCAGVRRVLDEVAGDV